MHGHGHCSTKNAPKIDFSAKILNFSHLRRRRWICLDRRRIFLSKFYNSRSIISEIFRARLAFEARYYPLEFTFRSLKFQPPPRKICLATPLPIRFLILFRWVLLYCFFWPQPSKIYIGNKNFRKKFYVLNICYSGLLQISNADSEYTNILTTESMFMKLWALKQHKIGNFEGGLYFFRKRLGT